MQASHLVRTLAAVASIALVALALMGASWYAGEAEPAVPAQAVGVPTGQHVNGLEIYRLPAITVTAHRSDLRADHTR